MERRRDARMADVDWHSDLDFLLKHLNEAIIARAFDLGFQNLRCQLIALLNQYDDIIFTANLAS